MRKRSIAWVSSAMLACGVLDARVVAGHPAQPPSTAVAEPAENRAVSGAEAQVQPGLVDTAIPQPARLISEEEAADLYDHLTARHADLAGHSPSLEAAAAAYERIKLECRKRWKEEDRWPDLEVGDLLRGPWPRPGLEAGLDLLRRIEDSEIPGLIRDLRQKPAEAHRWPRNEPVDSAAVRFEVNSAARRLSEIWAVRMRIAAAEGRRADAVERFAEMISIANSCRSRLRMLDQLVGVALTSAAMNELMYEVGEGHHDEESMRACLRELERAGLAPAFEDVIDVENAVMQRVVQTLIDARARAAAKARDSGKTELELDKADAESEVDDIGEDEDAEEADVEENEDAISGVDDENEVMDGDDRGLFAATGEADDPDPSPAEILQGLELARDAAMALLKDPAEFRGYNDRDLGDALLGIGKILMTPPTARTMLQTHAGAMRGAATMSVMAPADVRAARVMLAIELHRLTTGRLPETLEELRPRWFGELPVDPLTGEPFKYKKIEGGSRRYLLYSVAADRRDNGGRIDRKNPWRGMNKGQEGLDYVFNHKRPEPFKDRDEKGEDEGPDF